MTEDELILKELERKAVEEANTVTKEVKRETIQEFLIWCRTDTLLAAAVSDAIVGGDVCLHNVIYDLEGALTRYIA